jgi:hypothetical protein
MTTYIHGAHKVEEQPSVAVIDEAPDCLCCRHFAVDFESMPELLKAKRPSRQPKRLRGAREQ